MAGFVGLFVVIASLAIFPACTSAQSTNMTNMTSNTTNNTTLPFFSLRISGSRWQAALASNYSEISNVVRATLSDALDVPESNIIVVSLSVGSLVAIFLVESAFLTTAQVLSSVNLASLASLQAVYQQAAQTNETLTLLSISAESQHGGGCGDTCIAVSVVAAVVGTVLVVLLVWWLFRMMCPRHENGKPSSSSNRGMTTGPTTVDDHQPIGGVTQPQHGGGAETSSSPHPIQQWQERHIDMHEQPLPVHTLDYPREHNTYGGGGTSGAREMQHYNPHTTFTISPQSTRLSGIRLDRAAAAAPQEGLQRRADYFEAYQTPARH
jgi:hypothetical protein